MALRPEPYHTLALCAGAGGLELGVELAVPNARCVAYVEREAYAAGTLVARMEAGQLAPAPVWSDLTTFDARPWRGRIHCVTSGDPCQENSVAGRGLGAAGIRFLAPEVVRIADECRPDRIFRENVPGNADGQLEAIVPALERLGYRVAAGIFSAAGVGAPHQRQRLFIMADRIGGGQSEHAQLDGWPIGAGQAVSVGRHSVRCDHHTLGDAESVRRGEGRAEYELRRGRDAATNASHAPRVFPPGPGDISGWLAVLGERPDLAPVVRRRSTVADPDSDVRGYRHDGEDGDAGLRPYGPERGRATVSRSGFRRAQSGFRRVADGLANRVDRLRLCGNGVHPLAAGYAWIALDALLADAAASDAAVRSAA